MTPHILWAALNLFFFCLAFYNHFYALPRLIKGWDENPELAESRSERRICVRLRWLNLFLMVLNAFFFAANVRCMIG